MRIYYHFKVFLDRIKKQDLLTLLSVIHVIRWYLCFIFNIFFLIACLYWCILEPLQKLRVRLWPCKIGLNPPVTLCY